MKKISELSESDIDRTIAAADFRVVVGFYAPWCGPGKILAPQLEQLTERFHIY